MSLVQIAGVCEMDENSRGYDFPKICSKLNEIAIVDIIYLFSSDFFLKMANPAFILSVSLSPTAIKIINTNKAYMTPSRNDSQIMDCPDISC